MRVKLAPSILSAAFERLGEEVRAVEEGGADQIHVDVMDGHFVPNLSMGPIVVEALRRVTRLPLDVHLMITDPAKYAESFVLAGASHITFHVEAEDDPPRLAQWLKERGVSAGIALNPGTAVARVLPFLDHFALVLVMTVNPGFGGQAFLGDNLAKVRAIRGEEGRLGRLAAAIDVQVDGGIDAGTVRRCLEAGANVFVAGSSIFRTSNPREAVHSLRLILEGAMGQDGPRTLPLEARRP